MRLYLLCVLVCRHMLVQISLTDSPDEILEQGQLHFDLSSFKNCLIMVTLTSLVCYMKTSMLM